MRRWIVRLAAMSMLLPGAGQAEETAGLAATPPPADSEEVKELTCEELIALRAQKITLTPKQGMMLTFCSTENLYEPDGTWEGLQAFQPPDFLRGDPYGLSPYSGMVDG